VYGSGFPSGSPRHKALVELSDLCYALLVQLGTAVVVKKAIALNFHVRDLCVDGAGDVVPDLVQTIHHLRVTRDHGILGAQQL
jgi:hypothetical protein